MDKNNIDWENVEHTNFNMLEGFEKSSEIQELIIGNIEKVCSYSLTSEQKAAIKLSFSELQRQSRESITFLDLFNCWQNSPLLAELARRIKKTFLFSA
jgi:hypothetical protein